MKNKEIEASKYAHECSVNDGLNPTFDSYDAKEMRECAFMQGYGAALTSQWSNINELPENGAHCFIKKRMKNDTPQWQWDYSIAEFVTPTSKGQVPVFRVYDMTVRLEEVSCWMLIPKE